jgi:predicted permease
MQEALLFAINAVTSIVAMMAIGYFLKKVGLMSPELARSANKLVFYLFLPAMLFLNIYKIDSITSIDMTYAIYAVAVVLLIFAVFFFAVKRFTPENSKRGALLQASFRSNYALIGIPLAESLFGAPGVAVASMLSAVTIPCFNALAVISLTVFRESGDKKHLFRKTLVGIAKNPLIHSVLLGVVALLLRSLFASNSWSFRLTDLPPIYTIISNLAAVATPLALISLGAQFEFSVVSSLKREIIFGTISRVVVVPLLGLGIPLLFFRDAFSGAHYAAFVALFATPTAVSSVPMAQEMGADTELAGQLVVWSTLVSILTIFSASFVLKQLGIF